MSVPGTRKRLGYIPIGYKLMLSYMIFTVILVSMNGYVSHSMYDSSMRQQTRTHIQSTVLQIRENVAYKADDLTRISSMLYDDYNLVQNLRARESGRANDYRMRQMIIPKLESASRSVGFNQRLSLYVHNETVNEVYPEQTYNIYHMKRIRDKSWYAEFPEEQYGVTTAWMQVEEDAEEGRISLIRRLVDTADPLKPEELGMMRFSVALQELFESVNDEKLGEGSGLLVKDAAGKTLHASGDSEASWDWADEGGGRYVTIEEEMPGQGWTIVARVPMTIIAQEAKKATAFIVGICVLCFFLFTFAGAFISRYFSKRITKFVSVLNAFREGDLHKRISYKGKDEFSQIATALNGMGEDVGSLIHKVYLTQLQRKEAELEMLQTQINPHFLYNTLSSINRLAKFGENEKLQRMVVQLGRFYRLTLNSGRTLIPIVSEIEQSNAYLDIQKVKYGDRLQVLFDVDVSVWPYETIKIIVQPFIENALKHAWSGDRIHIRVSVRKEGEEIRYSIIDDGLGMPRWKIRDILHPASESESETGFGIRNIDQRIKLQYGAAYGVSIFSGRGVGTTVQLRIPARRRAAARKNATSNEI
ncbi:cache domain-containing sensor histidine kinase [Cohnella hongkongensis]|uniref:histidine kinase n=1 Tax=Cohnella hongkongensis TaxID=178337 RepID=A0ABV9FIY1_9BACL